MKKDTIEVRPILAIFDNSSVKLKFEVENSGVIVFNILLYVLRCAELGSEVVQ